ncbi:hypothetical protein N9B73_10105 [Verrucomicrobiales bacterium]|jgi:hypothetical protein|nr:hypothetical protein [Verrucomicrobiales bacterium]
MAADGLDELFLPADTTEWNPATKTIEGAIIDDEIKEWVDEIRETGAFVWIVFDSCHSGTMTRGTGHKNRVNRRIDPALLIPKAALVPSGGVRSALPSKVETSGEFASKNDSQKGGIVAIYAAQSIVEMDGLT